MCSKTHFGIGEHQNYLTLLTLDKTRIRTEFLNPLYVVERLDAEKRSSLQYDLSFHMAPLNRTSKTLFIPKRITHFCILYNNILRSIVSNQLVEPEYFDHYILRLQDLRGFFTETSRRTLLIPLGLTLPIRYFGYTPKSIASQLNGN